MNAVLRSITGRYRTMLLLFAVAYLLPRVVAYRGISRIENNGFNDMSTHLTNVSKSHGLSCQADTDPYFRQAPGQRVLAGASKWPHGVYHVARPWVHLFGPLSIWTTQLTNLVFSLVLMVGVFWLGVPLGGTRVGLWGALLTLLCPPLVASTWYFSLDYPLVAMVTVGLLLLWKTAGFGSRGRSLIFAAWSCLGMFIKGSYALYLLVPALWNLACGLRQVRPRWRVPVNLTLAVVCTLLGLLLLQGFDLIAAWEELRFHMFGAGPATDLSSRALSPAWLLAIPLFVVENFSLVLLLCALPGLILLHYPGFRGAAVAGAEPTPGPASPRALGGLLKAMVWGTYLVLTLMSNKLERYVHPLYPVLCLLVPWAVGLKVPRPWRTPALLWITTAACAMNWLYHQQPNPWAFGVSSPGRNLGNVEFKMPDQGMLRRLRGHSDLQGFHGPLLRALQDLARISPSGRPLGIAFAGDEEEHPPSTRLARLTRFGTVLLAAQHIPGRMVFLFPLTSKDPLPPALIIIQTEGEAPLKVRPMRLLGQRRVKLMVEGRLQVLILSLVAPTGR